MAVTATYLARTWRHDLPDLCAELAYAATVLVRAVRNYELLRNRLPPAMMEQDAASVHRLGRQCCDLVEAAAAQVPHTDTGWAEWTGPAIEAAILAAGKHLWWAKARLHYLSSRIQEPVYEGPLGVYFVTAEENPGSAPRYTVRRFDPAEAEVSAVGAWAAFTDLRRAGQHARRMAGARWY